MFSLRAIEELAGARKTREQRAYERELSHVKRATMRAKQAADMIEKINDRLQQAKRDGPAPNLPDPGPAAGSRR
jgi:hypothetical protein